MMMSLVFSIHLISEIYKSTYFFNDEEKHSLNTPLSNLSHRILISIPHFFLLQHIRQDMPWVLPTTKLQTSRFEHLSRLPIEWIFGKEMTPNLARDDSV